MEIFIKKFEKTKTKVTTIEELHFAIEEIEKTGRVIQIALFALLNDRIIIEYNENFEENSNNDSDDMLFKSEEEKKFEDYLDTIINNDPFGGRYSGKMIREIFTNGDKSWLDMAFKKMHNTFILDRLTYILDRGGYGKITNK